MLYYQIISCAFISHVLPLQAVKGILSDGELNPGLPRDRRGYLPLYYLRFMYDHVDVLKINTYKCQSMSGSI